MRVPINSASADEISELYDISLRRALQIVDYRTINGPFHEPADLAPHIDWRLPEQSEPPKQRSWDGVIFCLVILLCMLYPARHQMNRFCGIKPYHLCPFAVYRLRRYC